MRQEVEQVMETVEPELDALERELAGEVTPEPHPFLALVLARMKTNPEEFSPDKSPWRAIIDQSKQYLTTEEKKALKAAERDVGLDHLHKKLMGRLLADKTPHAGSKYTTLGALGVGSGGTGYNATPGYLGSAAQTTPGYLGSAAQTTLASSATGVSYDALLRQVLERLDVLEG